MTPVYLPTSEGILAALWTLCLIFFFGYNALCFIQQKRNAAVISVTFLVMLLFWFLFLRQLDQVDGLLSAFLPELHVRVVFLVLILGTAAAVFQQRSFRIRKKNSITAFSIIDSFDRLSTGLCYYWDNGLVKLENNRMESICKKMTGRSLNNGCKFWEELKGGDFIMQADMECLQKGAVPIYRLNDNRIILFRKNDLSFEGNKLHEILATDISNEYRLSRELNRKQEAASQVNARLKELNKTITSMTMEKELLNARIALHDHLGQTLLLSKKYLTETDNFLDAAKTPGDGHREPAMAFDENCRNPGNASGENFLHQDAGQHLKSIDRRELLHLLQTNITLLKNNQTEASKDTYADIRQQASRLGVEIQTDTVLPEHPSIQELISRAVSTHLTNTVRHAGGDKIMISCKETGASYILEFKNNGSVPNVPLNEGGGLTSLRKAVEAAGGSMKILSTPAFLMKLVLKKTEDTDSGDSFRPIDIPESDIGV